MDINKKLISKYILLLAIAYIAEFGVNFYLRDLDPELAPLDRYWMALIPILMKFLFNAVIALILYTDIDKLKLKAPYAILCTLLFRPVGVCGFILYLIIRDRNESSQEPIDGILDR